MLQEQMMLLYALPLDPKVKEAPEMAEFHRSQPPGRPEAAGLPCTKAARPDPCLFSGFGQIFNRFSIDFHAFLNHFMSVFEAKGRASRNTLRAANLPPMFQSTVGVAWSRTMRPC